MEKKRDKKLKNKLKEEKKEATFEEDKNPEAKRRRVPKNEQEIEDELSKFFLQQNFMNESRKLKNTYKYYDELLFRSYDKRSYIIEV